MANQVDNATREAVRVWTELADTATWKRNGRGNMVRPFGERGVLTVFPRDKGYRWCINLGDGNVEFGAETYRSVERAIAAVAEFLAHEVYEGLE